MKLVLAAAAAALLCAASNADPFDFTALSSVLILFHS